MICSAFIFLVPEDYISQFTVKLDGIVIQMFKCITHAITALSRGN